MGIIPAEEHSIWLVALTVDRCVETAVCCKASCCSSTHLILRGKTDLFYPAMSDPNQLGYWEVREEHCWKHQLLHSCRSVLQHRGKIFWLRCGQCLAGESKLSAQRCLDVCPTALEASSLTVLIGSLPAAQLGEQVLLPAPGSPALEGQLSRELAKGL